ncbi:MAG: hypothetical protein M0R74_03355 [Dehalococcoidia bacterium]|jgi:hypothetical protein|nr:hypothetical protein [Dehalococcoidia bacterium]
MVLAEQAHIVPIIYPQGSSGATIDSDIVSMKNASHATIILTVGAQAGDFVAKVYEADAFDDGDAAIACVVYKEETTNSDQLGDRTAVTAADGVTTTTTNNIFYVFEIDAEDLTEEYPNIQLKLSGLDTTTYVSAVCILTGYAYQGKDQPTEIA